MTLDADSSSPTMSALVAFIEGYRPGFSAEIVPADEGSIAVLEKRAGPLPSAYVAFLRTMGKSMGDVEIGDAYFGIEGNIATYRAMPWLKRERYLLIAGDEGLSEWDYFMDRAHPYGDGDCMVVRMPLEETFPPDDNHPKFISLEEFLYYSAFETLRMSQFERRLHFEVDKGALQPQAPTAHAVCALAEQHGFRRVAPTPRCALYNRDNAALLLHRHPIEPTYEFWVHCNDEVELARLKTAFEDLTGLRAG